MKNVVETNYFQIRNNSGQADNALIVSKHDSGGNDGAISGPGAGAPGAGNNFYARPAIGRNSSSAKNQEARVARAFFASG
jgi:hypothetical protein